MFDAKDSHCNLCGDTSLDKQISHRSTHSEDWIRVVRLPDLNDVTAHGGFRKSDYRPEIDGLRALAVIAVIIDHFNKTLLPSGYLGVDIFFVISGYVISSSLYNNSAKAFGDFISGFYSRRLKRLVPALVLCVLMTGLLFCLSTLILRLRLERANQRFSDYPIFIC